MLIETYSVNDFLILIFFNIWLEIFFNYSIDGLAIKTFFF